MYIHDLVIASGAFCAAIMGIWTLGEKISKPIKTLTIQIQDTIKRLDDLIAWQKMQQADIDISKIEREIICRGLKALCIWAISQGANGEVTRCLADLKDFLNRQSHK